MVVLESAMDLAATVGKVDLVLFTQRHRGFDCAVAAANDEDVLVLVFSRRVEAMVDLLAIFT